MPLPTTAVVSNLIGPCASSKCTLSPVVSHEDICDDRANCGAVATCAFGVPATASAAALPTERSVLPPPPQALKTATQEHTVVIMRFIFARPLLVDKIFKVLAPRKSTGCRAAHPFTVISSPHIVSGKQSKVSKWVVPATPLALIAIIIKEVAKK